MIMQISHVARYNSSIYALHRHFLSKIHFRYGRIAGLTVHARCLEWRKAAQGKKEIRKKSGVSSLHARSTTIHSIQGIRVFDFDQFTWAHWSLIFEGFAVSDHRPTRVTDSNDVIYTYTHSVETGSIRDQREGNNPLSMINDRSLNEADKVRVNIQMFDNQMHIFFLIVSSFSPR